MAIRTREDDGVTITARIAADRYVRDAEFRRAFDEARAAIERERFAALTAEAEALGYALVRGAAESSSGGPKAAGKAAVGSATAGARRSSRPKGDRAPKATAKDVQRGGAKSGSEVVQKVVAFLRKHPGSRKGEVAEGVGVPLGGVTVALRSLRKAKRVTQSGTTRAATYRLKT